jgi:hypothetical protein
VALVGTGRGKKAFEFDTCHHVGVVVVAIHVFPGRVVGLETGGEDDGTHGECQILVLVLVVDGSCGTFLLAVSTFPFGEFDAFFRVDAVLEGNGLGVEGVDGFPLDQALVVEIGRASCRERVS